MFSLHVPTTFAQYCMSSKPLILYPQSRKWRRMNQTISQTAATQHHREVRHVLKILRQYKCVNLSEVRTLTSPDTALRTELPLTFSKFTDDIIFSELHRNSWTSYLIQRRLHPPVCWMTYRKGPIRATGVITRGGSYYIKGAVCGS